MGGRGSHADAVFVRSLLDPSVGARTRGGVLWAPTAGTSIIGKVEVLAPTIVQDSARLEIRVTPERRETFFCSYIADGGTVRRLCVNKPRGSALTHKHRSEVAGLGECYEPTDIPFVPRVPEVPSSVYLEVLQAFANECNIELSDDFAWSAPWEEAL